MSPNAVKNTPQCYELKEVRKKEPRVFFVKYENSIKYLSHPF